jgi:thiamine-phosphate pyrophosphorylase
MTRQDCIRHALKLYLVLDPDLCGGTEGMIRTAVAAVENGVTMVQLRSKEMNKGQWYQAGIALKAALSPYNVPLIVNDHVDVAMAIDADGVHVGQKDLPVAAVRKLIGPEKWLGLSTSYAEQIAAVPTDIVDYIGTGPVFPTNSKKDADPALGLETLKAFMQNKPCPVVAIGGITADTAAAVMRCGPDGIAVVSAICGQDDPALATKELLIACHR